MTSVQRRRSVPSPGTRKTRSPVSCPWTAPNPHEKESSPPEWKVTQRTGLWRHGAWLCPPTSYIHHPWGKRKENTFEGYDRDISNVQCSGRKQNTLVNSCGRSNSSEGQYCLRPPSHPTHSPKMALSHCLEVRPSRPSPTYKMDEERRRVEGELQLTSKGG